ncbi:hypothetical protein H9P43_006878 [Blastocladiella emersonii ATCC 22665]|nr:hypothetical protein H9P43_006878 [Blastocladiella emersonii ATCC 22665]
MPEDERAALTAERSDEEEGEAAAERSNGEEDEIAAEQSDDEGTEVVAATPPAPTPPASSPSSIMPVLARFHVLFLLGVLDARGPEPLAHLYGAYVLWRLLNLILNNWVQDLLLARIRQAVSQHNDVLVTAMQGPATLINYRTWARAFGGSSSRESAPELVREGNVHTEISLFYACVADNLKAALGCGKVFVHPDATKIEVVSALINTINTVLIKNARAWYRTNVYENVNCPAWLNDDGSSDPAWERFHTYAKLTPLLMFMRLHDPVTWRAATPTTTKHYRVVQRALDAASACAPTDLLGRLVDITQTIFASFGYTIPMLGLRVPETRRKMAELVLQVVDEVPYPHLKMVIEIALMASISPAHLKLTRGTTLAKSNVIIMNADPSTRTQLVQHVMDAMTRAGRSECLGLARVDGGGMPATAVADTVKKHEAKLEDGEVEQIRATATVNSTVYSAAIRRLGAKEGPPCWEQFCAAIHLLATIAWKKMASRDHAGSRHLIIRSIMEL